MFEKGDLVTYGCKGVCEVKNITTLNRRKKMRCARC